MRLATGNFVLSQNRIILMLMHMELAWSRSFGGTAGKQNAVSFSAAFSVQMLVVIWW